MFSMERMAHEGGEAGRRKGVRRTSNPYSRGSKYHEIWDNAWLGEDDRLKQIVCEAIFGLSEQKI